MAATECLVRVNRVVLTLGLPLPVYPYQPTSTHRPGWSVSSHLQTFTVA